jgi:tryptophan halogenase
VVKYREGVFLDASWVAVYLGQGVIPEGHDLRADGVPADQLARGMQNLQAEIDAAVAGMTSHRAYINAYCPMADPA